jgi:deazaflavin-dependent oxidoreductase (nitroreductase family)
MKSQTPPNQRIIQLCQGPLAPLIGRLILLLTTTGRKSGLPRITPLQYEEVDGCYYIGSARGTKADWFRNILANPQVEVQVKGRRFSSTAEPITDTTRITDFLLLRLRRHPLMVRLILASEGLPFQPDREELAAYAARLAMVILRPMSL